MSIYAVYFSPTKSTEKIVKWIAGEFGEYKEIDLSRQGMGAEKTVFHKEDICVFGVPSYGGRVPAVALERMRTFHGNGAKAVLLTAYGNRDYEDTLLELYDSLTEKGFCCIAAVAAIAEHSIMHQFAAGRPDRADEKELKEFAVRILKKITSQNQSESLKLPGNRPYRNYAGLPLKPKAAKSCTKCGLCASMCPLGAIPKSKPNLTENERCISCMRCVAICPNKARRVNKLKVKLASIKMKKVCTEHKKNELFL